MYSAVPEYSTLGGGGYAPPMSGHLEQMSTANAGAFPPHILEQMATANAGGGQQSALGPPMTSAIGRGSCGIGIRFVGETSAIGRESCGIDDVRDR